MEFCRTGNLFTRHESMARRLEAQEAVDKTQALESSVTGVMRSSENNLDTRPIASSWWATAVSADTRVRSMMQTHGVFL